MLQTGNLHNTCQSWGILILDGDLSFFFPII